MSGRVRRVGGASHPPGRRHSGRSPSFGSDCRRLLRNGSTGRRACCPSFCADRALRRPLGPRLRSHPRHGRGGIGWRHRLVRGHGGGESNGDGRSRWRSEVELLVSRRHCGGGWRPGDERRVDRGLRSGARNRRPAFLDEGCRWLRRSTQIPFLRVVGSVVRVAARACFSSPAVGLSCPG